MRIAVILAFLLACPYLTAQTDLNISLLENTKVTDYGLLFDNYFFGSRITPHGDCIDIAGDYIFVTWYKGGMLDRHVMLSRMKIGTGLWNTIEFPHQHVGFRGDPLIGDSHNTIAVAVCPIDNTVHLLYDMHAYDAGMLPDDYFNYSVSIADAAFVPDEQWTIDLFYPKRNYLKAGVNYEKVTYPKFSRFDDGSLAVSFRIGGSGSGDSHYSFYDGASWSDLFMYCDGTLPSPLTYSVYGHPEYLHGKFHWGYSIRYATRTVPYNQGFYYAWASYPFSVNDWHDVNGLPITLPVQDPNVVKIGEPTELGVGDHITSTKWTVSPNGSIHFMTAVSGTNVHYYKSASDTGFSYSIHPSSGDLYSIGQYILLAGISSGRPCIMVAPEGTDQWQTVYQETAGSTIRHFNTALQGNTLVYYLMQSASSGDARPLHVMTYSIEDPDVDPPTPDPMTFAVFPHATSDGSISMTASTASDHENPVQYYFTCTAGGGHDSYFQPSPSYTDTNLEPQTQYTYTVTARDISANYNETAASAAASATTQADTYSPTPDPMTWATPPVSGDAGKLLVYEPFDYTTDVDINDLPAGALGLTGTWSGSNSSIAASGMTYGSLPVEGRKATFPLNLDGYCQAPLDPTAMTGYLDDGDTLWFSAVVYNGNTANNTIQFSLGGMTDGFGFQVANENSDTTVRISAVKWIAGVQTNSADSVIRPTSIGSGGNHLVVGKIVFGPIDTLEIYVPQTDLELPAAPIGTVSAAVDQSAMNVIGFNVSNGNTLSADEIRIGATYYNVVGDISLQESNTAIFMIADTAVDWAGVEYYFAETSGNPGSDDSGWQDSPSYNDTGLTPYTTYTYKVMVHDLSSAQNSTGWSTSESAVAGMIASCAYTCGDIDGSGGNVVLADFGKLAGCWGADLTVDTSCICADLVESGDHIIDLLDLSVFAELFLSTSEDYPPNDCSASVVDPH
jgi:hypothetical protein